jgi:hypothetical protein
MISLALRKQDIIKLIALIAIALAIPHLAEMRGLDLNFYPFVSLLILAASVLTDAYFNSRREQRELERAAYEKAAPLAFLHHKITEQIAFARIELDGLRSESESIKITNAIAQLDRESAVALLRKLSQPKRIDVWLDRGVGFLLGVAGSILASYLYSLIQAGSNA